MEASDRWPPGPRTRSVPELRGLRSNARYCQACYGHAAQRATRLRIEAAKTEAGRAFGFVKMPLPQDGRHVARQSFTFRPDKKKLAEAELRNGHYLLRTNLTGGDPAVLWDRYIQLTQIEMAFKCLKSELGLRSVYHQLEQRVEAHILVAFLAYCLMVTLKNRVQAHAPGLTAGAVLEKLATIQMLGG